MGTDDALMKFDDDDGEERPQSVHQRLLAAFDETQDGQAPARLKAFALAAIRDNRFDLAERLLRDEELTLEGLIENLRIYQAELEIQNEELRKSQAQTETALARFTALFKSSPVAELVLDHHGLIIEANPEARSLLQLRDTRSHQYFLARLLHHDDRGRIIRAWEQLAENQTTEVLEARFQPADGIRLFADIHIARLPADEHLQPRFVCAIIDRSDAVRQREALRVAYDRLESSEERYRVLAEFSPEWDYWLGTDGRFIHVSPACLEVTGYSAADFIQDPKLLEHIMHADDRLIWQQHFSEPWVQDRDNAPLTFRIRTRDGQQRWIEHVCGPVLAEDGRDLGRRGVNRDITARRATEDALRRSEALLNATGHLARVGGWELDIDTGTLRWTAITRELHEVDDDYQPDIDTALDFYHPDDRNTLNEAIKRTLDTGIGYELELRLCTAKGRQRWVKTNAELVRDEHGKRALQGSIQDISGRVEAERARRESEARFRSVFDSAPLAIAVMDADGRTVMANAALEHFLGYSASELASIPCSDYTHPDDLDADCTYYRELIAGDRGSYTKDKRYLRKDGEVVWGRLTVALVRKADQDPVYAIGMIADIGKELAAKQREIQARTVFENTSEGIIITDAQQRILGVNRAFTEITGYQEHEVLGKRPSLLRSGRQEDSFYQSMWAGLKTTGQWRGEFWNRRKNGEIYPQLSTISVVYDHDGQVTNYIGVFGDITQRKQSEEALYDLAHKDALTGLPNRALLRAPRRAIAEPGEA
jgi:PAS domain S-box-containing protein